MKTAATIVLLTFFLHAFSQDKLITNNDHEILVTITNETSSEIYFMKYASPDSIIYMIDKSDLKRIIYQNASEMILKYDTDSSALAAKIPASLYEKGKHDAFKYYKSRAGKEVLLTSIFGTPLCGLALAADYSFLKPAITNLPDKTEHYIYEPDYLKVYMKTAQKIRLKKVWGNFIVVTAIDAVAVILYLKLKDYDYLGGDIGDIY